MDDIELDPDFNAYWNLVLQFKKDCTEDVRSAPPLLLLLLPLARNLLSR